MATYPKWWSEGDTVTHTELNKYGTALTEAYNDLGDYGIQFASPFRLQSGDVFTVYKTHRYLHFRSVGALDDPSDIYDSITLTEDPDTGRGTLDLDTVDWLIYGQKFYCSGVNAVWLDEEP